MKTIQIGILLLSLLTVGCTVPKVTRDRLTDGVASNGMPLLYQKGHDEPFTGVFVSYDDEGRKEWEWSYRDGIRSGISTWWYPSGQLQQRTMFRADKEDGEEISWYDNGQIEVRQYYHAGVLHGMYTYWHTNGFMAERHPYLNGSATGQEEEWYENGKRKLLGELRGGEFVGEMTMWYTNGTLRLQRWMDSSGGITNEVYRFPDGQKQCERIWENNGWKYLGEWDDHGNPIIGTEKQHDALDPEPDWSFWHSGPPPSPD